MDAVSTVAGLIGPVFLMLALGVALRQAKLMADAGWAALSRLTYVVLIPSLILTNLAPAEFGDTPVLPIAGLILGGLAIMATLLFAVRPVLRRELALTGPGFCSLFQGGMRFNMFIALPLMAGLYAGENQQAAIAATAVAIGILPPTVNIAAVVLHLKLGDPPKSASGKEQKLLASLATNPLIVAIAAALFLNLSGIGWGGPLLGASRFLGDAAIPMGLLTAGAGLRLRLPDKGWLIVGLAVGLKLVVMPGITAVLALSFGVSDLALSTAVVCMATPCATASYILAQQLGGDAPMMAAMIAMETSLSILSLSVVLYLLLGVIGTG